MNKNITVIGATGLLGSAVTKALVNAGYHVTAMVRDIQKARKMLPYNINFVNGDLQNVNSIFEAAKTADGVYINLNATFNDTEKGFNAEREGIDNIVTALKKTSVKQVAFLSSFRFMLKTMTKNNSRSPIYQWEWASSSHFLSSL